MRLRTKIIQILIGINEGLFFYPRLLKFYKAQLGKGNLTIIDVGVNKGQSIDFFSKLSKQLTVFGFEPNKRLYDLLVKKYIKNEAVTLINKGISSKTGTLTFHENIMDETSTFEQLNYNSEYLHKKARVLGVTPENIIVGRYDVEVTTLHEFLKDKSLFFDVLKIDVEGHELSVLKGLFTNQESIPVRFIQLESHNDNMYINLEDDKQQIETLLQKNGFTEAARIQHGFGNFYEIVYKNVKMHEA